MFIKKTRKREIYGLTLFHPVMLHVYTFCLEQRDCLEQGTVNTHIECIYIYVSCASSQRSPTFIYDNKT